MKERETEMPPLSEMIKLGLGTMTTAPLLIAPVSGSRNQQLSFLGFLGTPSKPLNSCSASPGEKKEARTLDYNGKGRRRESMFTELLPSTSYIGSLMILVHSPLH